jgi:hypothetical protein
MASAIQALRAAWSAVTGGGRVRSDDRAQGVAVGVVVHDPAAQKAKNLDDPFLETAAQERVGELIARATHRPEDK